jgi:hypothetical protein
MLPFLDQKELYDRIDLQQPWDAEAYAAFRDSAPHLMQCHSREDGTGNTQYFAVVSPNSVWRDAPVAFDDITDGKAQTLLFIELDLPNVNWMSPTDVSLESLLTMLSTEGRLPAPHPDVVLCVFADGAVHSLPHEKITPELLRAIVSIDGGESIPNISFGESN